MRLPWCGCGAKSAARLSRRISPATLAVQLGTATEDLNRRWFERETGRPVSAVQAFRRHPTVPFIAATLDGMVDDAQAVFEAKFMLPWSFSEEFAADKHMAQLQHNMLVTGARRPTCPSSPAAPNGC